MNLLDVLPARHAVNALSTVVSPGSNDVGYELGMLAALAGGSSRRPAGGRP